MWILRLHRKLNIITCISDLEMVSWGGSKDTLTLVHLMYQEYEHRFCFSLRDGPQKYKALTALPCPIHSCTQQAVQWLPNIQLEVGDSVGMVARHDTYSVEFQASDESQAPASRMLMLTTCTCNQVVRAKRLWIYPVDGFVHALVDIVLTTLDKGKIDGLVDLTRLSSCTQDARSHIQLRLMQNRGQGWWMSSCYF